MKLRLFASILALSLVAWGQGNTPQGNTPAPPPPNSTPAPETKGCCHHMADMKDGKGCCHHAKAEGKDAMACCGKDKCEMKDGKSCCDAKDMKACMEQGKKDGKGCCADGKCGADGKGCCGSAADKTTANCCGDKCERHQHVTPGS
ncbi:MAG: hypothetical protein ACHP7J_00300 [Terriglobales bacterium]